MSSSARRTDAAFTLLEVLAAVAVLAIAYSTLGSSGIQGLQHEGEARRRLEASLLADAVLGEIEAGVEGGATPPVGRDEREEGDFLVTIAVEPYTLRIPEDGGESGKRIGRARSRLGGDAAVAPPPPPGPSLLGAEGARGGESPLRRITVEVAWQEGVGERSTRRTTWALDVEAASEALAAIAQSAAAGAGGAGGQPNNPLGGDDRPVPEGSAPPLQQRP